MAVCAALAFIHLGLMNSIRGKEKKNFRGIEQGILDNEQSIRANEKRIVFVMIDKIIPRNLVLFTQNRK